ncbi:MAG: hypothetical protein Pg6C_17250 [Treponemataceae bacterium]|nr:MAG: hypothetical protein Pg6C_17250 [Treponemataceae bacterium]
MEKRMTKAMVIKLAKEAGISITLITAKRHGGETCINMVDIPADLSARNLASGERYRNIPEVDRLIREYNRQARKLIAVLKKQGVFFQGIKYGSGEWAYTTRKPNYSDWLAANNID